MWAIMIFSRKKELCTVSKTKTPVNTAQCQLLPDFGIQELLID